MPYDTTENDTMSENNRPESARQVTVRVVWDADSDSSTWIATAARTGSRPEVEVITTTPCGRVYVARSVRRREIRAVAEALAKCQELLTEEMTR
jgi:hypothetical protein